MNRFLRYCGLGILVLSIQPHPAEALNLSRFGLVGVANVSQFQITPSSGAQVTSNAHMTFGGGAITEISLNRDAIGIELGALYVQRKYGDATLTLTETRVEVPVMLRLWFGAIGIGAGAYGAYGLGDVTDESGATSTYTARELNKLDFGWVGSTALAIGLGQRSTKSLLIDGRMSQSLGNASTQDDATGGYVNFQLIAGIQFKL